jgi:isopenicillin N synthase-like dioxygenase
MLGAMSAIPVLDLRDWTAGGARLHGGGPERRRSAFAAELRAAMEDTGFVCIEGHGIEAGLIARTYAHFERFFALPEQAKLACGGTEGGARGFTPFAVEHAKGCAIPDLKEFFHVGREFGEEHPRRAQYPPNQWPLEPAGLRSSALALYRELDACAAHLLEALACAYDLPEPTFAAMLGEGNSILRALHYPPLDPLPAAGALRAAPHEDINLITLLCEASNSGLEILSPAGQWLAVECGRGQIVADAGDMLCRLTGGVIPATTHRVANPHAGPGRERYSLPFFAHPAPECDLSVLECFATPERLAAYPSITAGEYLDERLREIGLGNWLGN